MTPRNLVLATLLFASALTANGAEAGSLRAANGMKCHLERVMDEQSQLVAFTFFVPDGWNSHGLFQWTKPGVYIANLSAATPDKNYSTSQLQRGTVTYNVMKNPSNGEIVSSQGAVIHHATDYLHTLVDRLQQMLNAEDIQVMDEVNGPLPADKTSMIGRQRPNDVMNENYPLNEAGFLQIKFMKGGVAMIAQMGTTVSGSNSVKHMPNRQDQVTSEGGVFVVGPTTIIVHPEAADPVKVKELQLITSSMAPNPKFIAFWRALVTRLANIQLGANAAAQKYADDHFHERIMSQFREDFAAKDTMSTMFCHYLQDEQDFKDKDGTMLTVPTSVQGLYTDGKGNYLISFDKSANPRGWDELPKYTFGN